MKEQVLIELFSKTRILAYASASVIAAKIKGNFKGIFNKLIKKGKNEKHG